jgi:dephospho-CoA kinase
VIDTDRIARQVVEPGQEGLRRIIEAFGTDYLEESGGLDRRKMREAIFSEPRLKSRLEAILHPLIAHNALAQIRAKNGPYCLLVIPLFAESESYGWVDRVLVVDVPESVQIKRVMARDGISRAQAEAILAAQAARSQRLELADDVLDNGGSLEDLRRQVELLHRKYLALA